MRIIFVAARNPLGGVGPTHAFPGTTRLTSVCRVLTGAHPAVPVTSIGQLQFVPPTEDAVMCDPDGVMQSGVVK